MPITYRIISSNDSALRQIWEEWWILSCISEWKMYFWKEEKRVVSKKEITTWDDFSDFYSKYPNKKGIDPNAKMKDSGIPWIWEIPESWTTTKLKFLLKHLTDWSHISVKSISEWHPYVTVANIDEQTWKIDLEGCQKISDEDYAILMGNWCKPKIWDILFSQIGTIWLTVEVKENDNFVMLSSLAILSPNNVLVDTQFLITYLRSSVIKEQYLLKMDWGAVKRITLNHIANFNINLPSIEIQHSIVDYIEKEVTQIDSAVYKIEQEITLIEEYRTSLIYQAVTGKIQIN